MNDDMPDLPMMASDRKSGPPSLSDEDDVSQITACCSMELRRHQAAITDRLNTVVVTEYVVNTADPDGRQIEESIEGTSEQKEETRRGTSKGTAGRAIYLDTTVVSTLDPRTSRPDNQSQIHSRGNRSSAKGSRKAQSVPQQTELGRQPVHMESTPKSRRRLRSPPSSPMTRTRQRSRIVYDSDSHQDSKSRAHQVLEEKGSGYWHRLLGHVYSPHAGYNLLEWGRVKDDPRRQAGEVRKRR